MTILLDSPMWERNEPSYFQPERTGPCFPRKSLPISKRFLGLSTSAWPHCSSCPNGGRWLTLPDSGQPPWPLPSPVQSKAPKSRYFKNFTDFIWLMTFYPGTLRTRKLLATIKYTSFSYNKYKTGWYNEANRSDLFVSQFCSLVPSESHLKWEFLVCSGAWTIDTLTSFMACP